MLHPPSYERSDIPCIEMNQKKSSEEA